MHTETIAYSIPETHAYDEELPQTRSAVRLGNPVRPRWTPAALWSLATIALLLTTLLLVTGYFWRQGV